MAGTKKPAQVDAKLAAAKYREALVDDLMDQLVGELAVKMSEWRHAREHRITELARLEEAERRAEESVVAAFDAARKAGAKVRALEKIDLKPTEAISAINKRAKSAGTSRAKAAKDAVETTAAKQGSEPTVAPKSETRETVTVG